MLHRAQGPGPARLLRSFSSATGHVPQDPPEGGNPCDGCVAPCCSTVTMLDLEPKSFRDVDYLGYLLGFERIELVFGQGPGVEVAYRSLCAQLDRRSARCRLHSGESKPQICRDYDATECGYRRQLLGPGGAETVRVSAARFPWVAALYRYDARGRIRQNPSLEDVRAAVKGDAPAPASEEAIAAAEALEARLWRRPKTTFPAAPPSPDKELREHADLSRDPCKGCLTPCCHVLLFPLTRPENASELSFYRYVYGFEGLELAATARGFVLQCHTRCRHLTRADRCRLFGAPARPVFCRAYDPWACRYVPTYVEGDPHFVRLSAELWPEVEALFELDDEGKVLGTPPFERVQELALDLAVGC
jgi:hypothetical protein